MPVIRFHLDSELDAAALMAVLTDYGPTRAQLWPNIDEEHFDVHALGDSWAEGLLDGADLGAAADQRPGLESLRGAQVRDLP